jgi:hypothetical protein
VAGCEWESSSGLNAWSERYTWVNFSGMYRGLDAPVVAGFSLASSAGPGGGSGAPGGGEGTQIIVNDEAGGTAPAFQTVLSGMLAKRPGITPGSVTMVLQQTVASGSSGAMTDNGGGGLSGSVNLVGPDPSTAQPATGTINYDTGAWTLSLTSPGLLTDCTILISYAYVPNTGGVAPPEEPEAGAPPWAGIYSLRVDQTGQHLVFTDGTGGSYSGQITKLTTPGGDEDGFTSGHVDALYEVQGTAGDGRPIRISGSFSASYLAPDAQSGSAFGVLDIRTIQGIWFELSGGKQTADLRGYTGSLSTGVVAPPEDEVIDPELDTQTTNN